MIVGAAAMVAPVYGQLVGALGYALAFAWLALMFVRTRVCAAQRPRFSAADRAVGPYGISATNETPTGGYCNPLATGDEMFLVASFQIPVSAWYHLEASNDDEGDIELWARREFKDPIVPPSTPELASDKVAVGRLRREVEGAIHELIETELARRAGIDL